MDVVLIRAGLLILGILGMLHLIYTLIDLKVPRYFAPQNKSLLGELQKTSVSIANNSKSFWTAYMGFNLSHSVGILVFVMMFGILSIVAADVIFHPAMTSLLICTGLTYTILAQQFWFSVPLIGSTLATALFILGRLVH